METRLYLMGAMLIVGCGCLGLVIVRISNPFLKGLGWLAGTFACGLLSTALLSLAGHIPRFYTDILANALSDLIAYIFLQAAILELSGDRRRIAPFSLMLLAFWLPVIGAFTYLHDSHQLRVEFGSILLGLQVLYSAIYLVRHQEKGVRVPGLFTAAVLLLFAAFNFVRAAIVAHDGMPQNILAPSPLQVVSVILYLTAPLGFAFGLFWMSTAKLRLNFERLASTDPLTGLWNRRFFRLACEKELSRSLDDRRTFSLLVADIDHFKRINDRYGHLTGDAVLCSIVSAIQTDLRPFDLLGRWGGEEFVVLLPDCSSMDALEVAERLRRGVQDSILSAPDETPIQVTMSLGVATCRGPQDPLDEIFRRADDALYQAKAAGRNRVLTMA
jgi:diguanylate cyclase (GGDEF)-like protein